MLCSENFNDHTIKNLWKTNFSHSVVHSISTTAHDTIAIFSAQIELFETYKVTIKREVKYAVLVNLQRRH